MLFANHGVTYQKSHHESPHNNELLTTCQYSFMKGRSCVTRLLTVLDQRNEAMAQGNNIDYTYLEFSKEL